MSAFKKEKAPRSATWKVRRPSRDTPLEKGGIIMPTGDDLSAEFSCGVDNSSTGGSVVAVDDDVDCFCMISCRAALSRRNKFSSRDSSERAVVVVDSLFEVLLSRKKQIFKACRNASIGHEGEGGAING